MKKLAYEITGQGETVVFLHPGVVGSHSWDKQVEALAEQYRLLTYDRPGFGENPASENGNSRRDLLELLDKLGIEKAHLVGSSAGGEIIMDFALEYPERVQSLTLVSSLVSGFELQGEPPADLMLLFGALQEGKIEEAARLATKVFLIGDSREEKDVPQDLRDKVYQMSLDALQHGGFMQQDSEVLHPSAMERLEEIAVPTLLIVGQKDNPAILKGAHEISQKLAQGRVIEIPNAAHFPNLEAPEIFNQTLREFLG